MPTDNNNSNKQLRMYGPDGRYMRLSVDECIARGLNRWEGWTCSSGRRGLYIDYDGHIWVCNTAAAKYGWIMRDTNRSEGVTPYGYCGHINDDWIRPPNFTHCQWKSCACGADVMLPKAAEGHWQRLVVEPLGFRGRDATINEEVDDVPATVAAEANFPIGHQILWDLSRRCNYDCSYCWPGVHDKSSPQLSEQLLVDASDRLIDKWAGGRSVRWLFGGGEPTVQKALPTLLRHLRNRGQWMLVTSNGSASANWWARNIELLNGVNLSAHFEFLKEPEFMDVVRVICEHQEAVNCDLWLDVKLMATPENFDRALALRDTIRGHDWFNRPAANGRIKGSLSLVPIRSRGDSGEVVVYTQEQLQQLQHQ